MVQQTRMETHMRDSNWEGQRHPWLHSKASLGSMSLRPDTNSTRYLKGSSLLNYEQLTQVTSKQGGGDAGPAEPMPQREQSCKTDLSFLYFSKNIYLFIM